MSVRLGELVGEIGGQLSRDADLEVNAVAPLNRAQGSELSFVASGKFLNVLQTTQAAVVVIHPSELEQAEKLQPGLLLWLHENPYLAYAKVTQRLAQESPSSAIIHPTAVLGKEVILGSEVSIGPNCAIGDRVQIGAGTVVHANVSIYPGCVIGARCIIHSGAVIGADGFGFAPDGKRWEKIIQTGRVVIGDDVEIGANTTIDRGALDDTIIASGVKLDNQIQVAHNVSIGDNTAIAGCVGIAGSTKIGANCTIGGAAMIFGHLEITDEVHISGATVVSKSLKNPGRYTGYFPIDTHQSWEHNAATVRQLAELRIRIRQLEKKLGITNETTDQEGKK
jgi:UDP-3-O-[3-hydroxymyristoyl] glucosamine N-acyltransferase